jgi:hypothetical protein
VIKQGVYPKQDREDLGRAVKSTDIGTKGGGEGELGRGTQTETCELE